MCQFCTAHGEGKKWYLQMHNYSQELLHADLTPEQLATDQGGTRAEFIDRFMETFVFRATGRVQVTAEERPRAERPKLSEAEILQRSQLVHYGQVLPIEDVAAVLDMASSITRVPCGCRYLNTGLADQRYCFGVGYDLTGLLGRYPDAASSLEVLDKDEALRLIRKFDEEGLMHSVWTGMTPYVIGVCNCDHDCGAYKWYIEKAGTPSFFRAEYVCQVDWERCIGCKECMSQCQFGAQYYSSANQKVYISPEKCFGCGVCRAACTQDAIQLLPRQSVPEAADLWLR
jgi:NAD-dependent dihydropyrimidine dehydrogenase PreA subunit